MLLDILVGAAHHVGKLGRELSGFFGSNLVANALFRRPRQIDVERLRFFNEPAVQRQVGRVWRLLSS